MNMDQFPETNYAIITSLRGKRTKRVQQSLKCEGLFCCRSGIDDFEKRTKVAKWIWASINKDKVSSPGIAHCLIVLIGNDEKVLMIPKREVEVMTQWKANELCLFVKEDPVHFPLESKHRKADKLFPNKVENSATNPKSSNLVKLLFRLKPNPKVSSSIFFVHKDHLKLILEMLNSEFDLEPCDLSFKSSIKFEEENIPSVIRQSRKADAIKRKASSDKVSKITTCHRSNSTSASMQQVGTLLHSAVNNGQFNLAKRLIDSGIDVNVTDEHDKKAIHYAVERRDLEMTKLLLSRGTKVNSDSSLVLVAAVNKSHEIIDLLLRHDAMIESRNKTGSTALHIAAACGDEEIAKLILSKGLDVNVATYDGVTPLHVAVQNEKIKMVKLLLQHGADVNVRSKYGNSPFHIAVGKGHSSIVEDLVKNLSMKDEKDTQAFYAAICGSSHYKKTVQVLLSHGFKLKDQDINNFELLNASIEKGYASIIHDVLQRGANANVCDWSAFRKNYTLLHSAAKNGRLEIAEMLIKYGCQVNALDGNKKVPLCYAVEEDDVQMTKLLINSGTNLRGDCSAFLTAVKKGNWNIIQELLKHDANVDSQDELGTTALHFAAWNGNEELVKLLLAKGIHMVNENSRRAVLQATSTDKLKRFISFLGYNDQDFRKEICTTPLHIAVRRKHKNIVMILLENGVDVNARDGSGKTALHVACRMRLLDMTEALLDHGADVRARDENGHSALHYLNGNGTCMKYYDVRGYDRVRCVCDQAFECMYELDFKCESEFDSTILVEVLVKHIAKMTFDTNVSEEVSQLINRCEKSRAFYQCCRSELQRMKDLKIRNVSFYDWLTKNVCATSVYARNEHLLQSFKLSECKREFPIYGKMLEKCFAMGEERLRLMDSAVSIFLFSFTFRLPRLVAEEIMQYLNSTDLRNLISTCDETIHNSSEEFV